MRTRANLSRALFIAIVLGGARLDGADPPQFLIQDPGGKSHIYEAKRSGANDFRVADERVDATIASIGPDQWELTLTAKAPLTEVWFPWPQRKIEPAAANAATVYSA